MEADKKWVELGWRHPLWNIVRLYAPLYGKNKIQKWESELREKRRVCLDDNHVLNVSPEVVAIFFEYIKERELLFNSAFNHLRSEEEALEYCHRNEFEVSKTTTENKDHHQSSKSMVSAVTLIAENICKAKQKESNTNPQTRCAWNLDHKLHVTARNLDGAIPSLVNPRIIWEIKEYWGKTKGGSKMSDALYECNLVGLELREFEKRIKQKIYHVVFVDGKAQWGVRKSDLKRFIDIMNQGLVDYLIIGKEVETEWGKILESIL